MVIDRGTRVREYEHPKDVWPDNTIMEGIEKTVPLGIGDPERLEDPGSGTRTFVLLRRGQWAMLPRRGAR
jgi:hypothetical protein